MRRSIAITSALVLALSSLLFVAEASARAGGQLRRQRGSSSYSAPQSPSQVSPSRPTAPASPVAPSPMQPQRSGWGGMIGGLLGAA